MKCSFLLLYSRNCAFTANPKEITANNFASIHLTMQTIVHKIASAPSNATIANRIGPNLLLVESPIALLKGNLGTHNITCHSQNNIHCMQCLPVSKLSIRAMQRDYSEHFCNPGSRLSSRTAMLSYWGGTNRLY